MFGHGRRRADGEELARTAVRGVFAVAAANGAVRLVSLAGTLYLIGQVTKGEFGIVDYAVALLTIAGSLGDIGFSHGAIHRQERVGETFSAYLVLRLVLTAGVLCVLGAGAVLLRDAVEANTRLDVLAVLGGAVLVDAACDVSAARLTKAMRFGRLAAANGVSAVVGTGVGVGMAAFGFGIWALAGLRASQSVVRAIGLWLATEEPTPLRFRRDDARWLVRFGLPLWLGGLATTWVLKYDDLVVGSLRNAETLGLYGRAYAIALLPLGLVTGVLTRVSFPLYARLQGERGRLSEAFRIASGTTLRLVAPMAVGLAVAVPDLIALMGWTQWRPMVAMLRWLLIYMTLRPLMDDAGGLLTAVGQPKAAGHTLLGEAAALLVLCPALTSLYGAEGAALSVGLVVVGGLAVWYVWYLPRFVDVAYRRILLWPLVSAGVGGAASLGVGAWAKLDDGLASGIVKLAALAAAYALALLALDGRQTLADLRTLRRHAFGERQGDG